MGGELVLQHHSDDTPPAPKHSTFRAECRRRWLSHGVERELANLSQQGGGKGGDFPPRSSPLMVPKSPSLPPPLQEKFNQKAWELSEDKNRYYTCVQPKG